MCFFLLLGPVFPQKWELAKSESNIKVYVREVKNSPYKEFRGITTVNAPLPVLVAVLSDPAAFPQWFHECPQASRLKTISPTEGINYMVYNLPWPFDDRDLVIHYLASQDADNKAVTYKLWANGNFIPHKSGLVRVMTLNGYWRFTPLDKGRCQAEYKMHLDPEGSIPGWLANSTVVDAPYNTLLMLHTQVKKSKYQNQTFEWLKQ